MSVVEVQRLRLRGPPTTNAVAAFRIEDALRTEIAADRLILVRRIDIGRLPGNARPRALADQLGAVWHGVLKNACHGGAPSAASANCVWFSDTEEARRLLIARLAAGHAADAWFWHLAVPDWQHQPLESWVANHVAVLIESADGPALLTFVETLVAKSALAALIRAFVSLIDANPLRFAEPHTAPQNESEARADSQNAAPGDGAAIADLATGRPPISHAAIAVAKTIASLPQALRAVLIQLISLSSAGRSAVMMIGDAVLLRRFPELCLVPGQRDAWVAEWLRQIANPASSRAIFAQRPTEGGHARPERQTRVTEPDRTTSHTGGDARASPPRTHIALAIAAVESESAAGAASPLPHPITHEIRSPAAGLLLTIIPLIQLGWRKWLADHHTLIGTAPAAHLLDTIAAHHRVPVDDPVRQLWRDSLDDPAPVADWLRLWRVGLDRWLVRHTRIKLARLIWRPGWLTHGDQSVRIRFPLGAADIRLRRMALDRDPGWVDWLGLSVRYSYRDTPELGWIA